MRTRQLKPDFFADEDVATLPPQARLLFMGLWLLADKRGRLEDRPLKIRAALFPYEPSVDVEAALVQLAAPKAHGVGPFVVRYSAAGRNYIQIANFERHQHCHPKEPESVIPAASREEPRQAPEIPEPTRGVPRARTSESVPSESVPSGSSENNGTTSAPAVVASPVPAHTWNAEFVDDFREVYQGEPAKQFFPQVQAVAKRFGWGRTRPVLREYMRETALEFLAIPKVLAVRIESGGGGPARSKSPPGRLSAAQTTVGAMREILAEEEKKRDRQSELHGVSGEIGAPAQQAGRKATP